MSGFSGFEYDVFISYAHLDNKTASDRERGWVDLFKDSLEIALDQMHGQAGQFKLWYDDRNLDGSMLFDERIKKGIDDSAVMLCFSSPAYFKSKYCTKERLWFLDKAARESYGVQVDDRHRMVTLFLNQIPRGSWPDDYQGRTGFPFYEAAHKQDLGMRLLPDEREFIRQLNGLSSAVYALLQGLREAPAPLVVTSPPVIAEPEPDSTTTPAKDEPDHEKPRDKPIIFMAEVSDTLQKVRKRTVLELEKEGYTVRSSLPPPYASEAHDAAVKEALEEASLSVHLLNEYPGREIDDLDEAYYSHQQASMALEFGKQQLIWVPKNLELDEVEEPNYKQFLTELESGALSNERLEYIKGMKSGISREVLDLMQLLESKAKSQQTAVQQTAVLLETHLSDQFFAFDLGKRLLEHGIQPFVNPQDDNPRQNIEKINERIDQVSQLIFLFGQASRDWVHERIKATLKHLIGLDLPPKQFSVILFPEKKNPEEAKPSQSYIPVEVFDNSHSNEISSQNLEALLGHLKTFKL